MPKTLIAIVNARHRQATWANVIRETWLPHTVGKCDAFFFVGRGEPGDLNELPADTVVLDCDDSYMGLPDKIRAIMKWAYDHDYEFVLKCDDDVILDVDRMLASGYDQFEYTGKANRPITAETPFVVPMGFNYWVCRRGMAVLIDAPLPENSNDDEKWVAANLYNRLGIKLHDDQRYRLHYGTLVSRPVRMHRPIRSNFNSIFPGEFSWCIFLEGNSGTRIPTEHKLAEFRKVFYGEVAAKRSTNQ
jgi:hypothetical protein